MTATGKFRNEDLSVYFFIKGIDIGGGKTLGDIATIVDGYPYNEIEQSTLVLPTISVEVRLTTDEEAGELGASWFRRSWAVDVFANNDTQRDDFSDKIFQSIDSSIPIKDYSVGFRKETGKSLLGTDLRIIEYMTPSNRNIRPTYAFNLYAKIKYWRTTISFETVSTQAS